MTKMNWCPGVVVYASCLAGVLVVLGAARPASAGWAPVWETGKTYTADANWVRRGDVDVGEGTYKCTQTHTSNATNKPPNAAFWVQVWPRRDPNSTGGAGVSGDDWADFKSPGQRMPWRDDQDKDHDGPMTWGIYFSTSNPNHDQASSRDTAGNRVRYSRYRESYGSTGFPSVPDGNRYWNWYYVNFLYTNLVTDCTTQKNCVSAAYHGYKGPNTVAVYWVLPADRGRYTAELNTISAAANDNTEFETKSGDRLDHSDHVWWVKEASDPCDELWWRVLRWKGGVSGVYEWNIAGNNDGPKERLTRYTSGYAVLRK